MSSMSNLSMNRCPVNGYESGNGREVRTSRSVDGPVLGEQVGDLVRCLRNRTPPFFWSAKLFLHDIRPMLRILIHKVFLCSGVTLSAMGELGICAPSNPNQARPLHGTHVRYPPCRSLAYATLWTSSHPPGLLAICSFPK